MIKGDYRIEGFNCQKAVYFDLGETKTFYYTKDIRLNESPERYNNLPGFIVKIETNSEIIELESYTSDSTCNKRIKVPKLHKKISSADWEHYLNSSVNSYQNYFTGDQRNMSNHFLFYLK
jgi:GLPGLI family protein